MIHVESLQYLPSYNTGTLLCAEIHTLKTEYGIWLGEFRLSDLGSIVKGESEHGVTISRFVDVVYRTPRKQKDDPR